MKNILQKIVWTLLFIATFIAGCIMGFSAGSWFYLINNLDKVSH